MKMSGEYTLNAGREAVWQALNDVDVLKASIPGCESIVKHSDTEMEAVAIAKVGPVKAKFKGKVQLSDLDPPNGYTISGEGSGGPAGFAKGGAKVALADADGGGTVLTYEVDATVGGKLAQIGQRLIDGAAKKMADEFFTNFAEQVGGKADDPVAEEVPGPASGDVPSGAANEIYAAQGSSSKMVYFGLAVAAAIVISWLIWA